VDSQGEITKKYEKKKKKYYVQAPVVDENTAFNFVKSLTSSRKKSSDGQSITQPRESSECSGDEKKEEHTMQLSPARRDHDFNKKSSGAKRGPTRKRNWDGVVSNPVFYAPPPHPALEELLDLKANNIRIFYSLSLEHCDIDTIDILFPKHEGRGILNPPPPYRTSASKLWEWRTRGNKRQREEISKHEKLRSHLPFIYHGAQCAFAGPASSTCRRSVGMHDAASPINP
jgi:hypothetical protein